jgi:hypothetical protein
VVTVKPSFSVCFILYKDAKPYLTEFIESLLKSCISKNVNFCIVNDGLTDSEKYLTPLSQKFEIKLEHYKKKTNFSSIRNQLLNLVSKKGSDYLIFTDCDDLLTSGALDLHLDSLSTHDFSYSDQILIDQQGNLLNRNLFDGWDVPKEIDSPMDLLDQNFIGFSGFGVKKSVLEDQPVNCPENITSVDWWLATLLLMNGFKGKKTSQPVVFYRQHDLNLLGSGNQDLELSTLKKKAQIALEHYKSLTKVPEAQVYLEKLEHLISLIDNNSNWIRTRYQEICSRPLPWFKGISLLAEQTKTVMLPT